MGLCFSSSTSSCASSELSIENCDTLKSYKVNPGEVAQSIKTKQMTEKLSSNNIMKNSNQYRRNSTNINLKHSRSNQKNQRRNNAKSNIYLHNQNKWAKWEQSEKAHRAERKALKRRFQQEYELDDLIKGTIVYDERRGLYKDELMDVEEDFNKAVRKQRRSRRIRKINESLDWYRN